MAIVEINDSNNIEGNNADRIANLFNRSNDILTGRNRNNNTSGGGSSFLQGTRGNDLLSVPEGNTNTRSYTILGISGNDTLTGGGGNDNINAGFGGSSLLNGGDGNDKLFGSLGDDTLNGGSGNDLLSGSAGDDLLNGDSGNDSLNGSLGNDILNGGLGNDNLSASEGDDFLFGDAGNDSLDGSAGSDIIFGGGGNDILTGGPSGNPDAPEGFFDDVLVGGAGSDTLKGFGARTGSGGDGTAKLFERDVLVGGGAVNQNGNITDSSGDGVKDVFLLADADGPFYTGSGNKDFAIIQGFEKGIDEYRLLSPGLNFRFGTRPNPNGGGLDTYVFAELPTGSDLIAIFTNVDLIG
ncbi:calcium-binding protein [Nostoc sphaeroides]|uniref:Calcium-binding protein n=1 Tax=Nostoc sphaeroides CCNUC1 TaxID=2653204 RepID=A0A5P8VX42_9NOSO|nr:calcium-binding protein [Nostoc sphaeroides]MCC5629421.1 calcium-binding protein [Nostoc sphaeroides CHAB 2801]QFS44985.1 calcium-binding protein [Nostoc sphaeroides CCNUC1]